MRSTILMAISAGILLLLGGMHLLYTFFGSKLLPRDPALHRAMSEVHLGITKETTVGRAWVGFNASHSMALMFFGLVFGFLALSHSAFLFGSAYLLAVGLGMLAGFLVLAKLYWFSVPFAGITVSLIAYIASIIAAGALCAACGQEPPPDRETDVTDPEVQELLEHAAKVDLVALGFSAPPATGAIRIVKKGPRTAPDANDAGLLTTGESPAGRNWFFNRAGDGYRLACAFETVSGTRTWERSDVTGGRPYREVLYISYVGEDPGVCGTRLKPGVSAIYWGPNGVEVLDGTEIVRLRAEIEKANR